MKHEQSPNQRLFEAAQERAATFELPENWQDGREVVDGYAIDEAYVQDVDDAVLATPGSEGNTILTVSIADTASFVARSNSIGTAAYRKGWTHYQDNRAVNPMLPRAISEDKLSLLDGALRPVFSLHIPVDSYGALQPATIAMGVIRARRFTPEHVSNALEQPEGAIDEAGLAIRSLKRLAQRLHHERTSHSLHIDPNEMSPERGETWASFIVQETMIAANRSMAVHMHTHDIPGLFRIFDGEGLACYSPHPDTHDALNVPLYVHGTSPLRRFPDFLNQANIVASMLGQKYPFPERRLERIAVYLNAKQEREYLRQLRKSPRHNTTAKPLSKVERLHKKLNGQDILPGDIADGLFYDGPNHELGDTVRTQAMDYITAHPFNVRQVLNVAAAKGHITVRDRKPEDPAAITTNKVVEDNAGNVYSFVQVPTRSKKVKGTYVKSPELIAKRGQQIVHDLQLLGSITGIEAQAELPLELQPEHIERAHTAGHVLAEINSFKPSSLQYSYRQENDVVIATVYMKIGGEIRAATVARPSKDIAGKAAAYQLALEYDLFNEESRAQLGLNPPPPAKKKTSQKNNEGHSPAHYLQQHLMKTVQIAPRYVFTRYNTDIAGTDSTVDCTVLYQDTSGRKHIICAESSGRNKAKSLVASTALKTLGAPNPAT